MFAILDAFVGRYEDSSAGGGVGELLLVGLALKTHVADMTRGVADSIDCPSDARWQVLIEDEGQAALVRRPLSKVIAVSTASFGSSNHWATASTESPATDTCRAKARVGTPLA